VISTFVWSTYARERWGGWGLLNVLLGTALARGGDFGLTPTVNLLQLVGGMLTAVVAVVRLVDTR
jgi:hypothetical protein